MWSILLNIIASQLSLTEIGPRTPRAARERLQPYRSAGERLREKRQALVHPVIDTAMVVGELLVAMRDAEFVQPPHEPAGTVEQIVLILFSAVGVERLQPAGIVRVGFHRNYRGLPPPIPPPFPANPAPFSPDPPPEP